MTKKQRILTLRSQGMKYRQIAEAVGVSYQYAALVCGQADPSKFRPFTPEDCVFPNLRCWLNETRTSKNELLRKMKIAVSGQNNARLRCILKGLNNPTKAWIDRMICATGLPYEQLFATEVRR